MISTSRYSRQIIMPEIGEAGQSRLSNARVLVVGAGGLGCPALQYLAGAGIGTIGIIDHDRVDETNLHRQILFNMNNIGKPKARAAGEHLLKLNPEIIIQAYDEELADKNVLTLFSSYDVILDGTDNFSAKFLINDAAVKCGKPVVYGAIQGFDGQVTVFDAARGPCYRCLHPQPPRGVVLNCAEAGVIGALAGMIGTMQAMEVIKLIVGHDSFRPLRGQLWMIDSRTMETNCLSIPKNPDCPVCSHPAPEIVLQYASPVCSTATVREIEIADLSALSECIMIDVREQEEWDGGHMPDARHMPLSALSHDPGLLNPYREKTCILYCQRGMRSRKAATILLEAGFQDVFSLTGGYEQWQTSQK